MHICHNGTNSQDHPRCNLDLLWLWSIEEEVINAYNHDHILFDLRLFSGDAHLEFYQRKEECKRHPPLHSGHSSINPEDFTN
jgi:hypothetical protein